MIYLALKYTHVAAVTTSFVLFFLRGLWMIGASERLKSRWVKVVPHVVDTVLLASAISMVVMSAQNPFLKSWIMAKVIALILYILLGMVALRAGRTRQQRVLAWILALTVFTYIVMVAITRNPVPWAGMADW